ESGDMDWVDRLRTRLMRALQRLGSVGGWLVAGYALVAVAIVGLVGVRLGREIFPASGAHQFQLRFDAPTGTKFEFTERLAGDILTEIRDAAGAGHVDTTLGYVGVQP